MKNRLSAPGGFTLLEIMLAMMLLAATGVSVLTAYSNSSRIVQAPENSAYYIGSKQLAALNEAVRADWWPNANRPLSPVGPAPQPPVEVVGLWTYTPVYAVNGENNGDGAEDYRRAIVTVTWP